MLREFARVVMSAAIICSLTGCGIADSGAPLPQFMRGRIPEAVKADPEPDMRLLLRASPEAVFLASANPRGVRVSQPRRNPAGSGWTACVRAEVTSVIGQPIGTQTYLVTIAHGAILDRRMAGGTDNCSSESYASL